MVRPYAALGVLLLATSTRAHSNAVGFVTTPASNGDPNDFGLHIMYIYHVGSGHREGTSRPRGAISLYTCGEHSDSDAYNGCQGSAVVSDPSLPSSCQPQMHGADDGMVRACPQTAMAHAAAHTRAHGGQPRRGPSRAPPPGESA